MPCGETYGHKGHTDEDYESWQRPSLESNAGENAGGKRNYGGSGKNSRWGKGMPAAMW